MADHKMRIAYLLRVRPDLEDIIPADVDAVRVEVGDDGLYGADALSAVATADAFIVGMEPVNEQILAAAPGLKIVQRLGVGYETLDLAATAKRGIPACNIEGVNKEAVAEHAMALILALAKRLPEQVALTRAADWAGGRKLTSRAFELKGKTLGIIGFGNTGSHLAMRARPFEMELLYNDTRDVNAEIAQQLCAVSVSRDELLARSDIVSICTDLNETSRHMINTAALDAMQPHAMLVCCARGGIVDEAALAEALQHGSLAAAAIDVFEREPISADNPLIAAPNCLLTSHVAGVASETTARIWAWAHDNVRAVVQRSESPRWVRNSGHQTRN